jgi:hypothetical protein
LLVWGREEGSMCGYEHQFGELKLEGLDFHKTLVYVNKCLILHTSAVHFAFKRIFLYLLWLLYFLLAGGGATEHDEL